MLCWDYEFINNIENQMQRTIQLFRLVNQVDQYFPSTMSSGLVEVTTDVIDGHVEV